MTPQTQTIYVGDEHGRLGNCWQYAIASLLDLHPDKVPHLVEFGDHWWLAFRLWLDSRGLHVEATTEDPGVPCIAIGLSARGAHHSVVWNDRKVLHDPHPSRDGLAAAPVSYEVILPGRDEGVVVETVAAS